MAWVFFNTTFQWILKITLALVPTVLVGVTNAKETWVNVTGIDLLNQSQNYTEFYQNIVDFSRACQMKSDRVCESYFYSDPLYARNALEAESTGYNKVPDRMGPTNKETYLKRLNDLISKSSKGDKIVISLADHGTTPPAEQGGRSCIMINAYECVSEEDLKKALSKLPKDLQVTIVADGCFSGAFADLANSNVCVVTAADQRHTGGVGQLDLWKSIQTGKIKNLADYSKKSRLESDTRLGSENMASNNCEALRKQIAKKFSEEDLKNFEGSFQRLYNSKVPCLTNPGNQFLLNFYAIDAVFKETKFQDLISEVCNSKSQEGLQQCSLLKKAAQNEESKKKLLDDYANAQLVEQYYGEMKKNAKKLAGLSPKAAMTIVQQLNALLGGPKMMIEVETKFSPEEQKTIQDIVSKVKGDIEKYEEAGEQLRQKSLALTVDDIDSDQVMELRRCLIQARFEAPIPQAEEKPLRQFSQQEILDAKKCEASFSF